MVADMIRRYPTIQVDQETVMIVVEDEEEFPLDINIISRYHKKKINYITSLKQIKCMPKNTYIVPVQFLGPTLLIYLKASLLRSLNGIMIISIIQLLSEFMRKSILISTIKVFIV